MGYLIRPVASTAPVAVTVPDDLAAELEELYAHLTANPGQLAFVEFSDEEATNDADETITIPGSEQRDLFVKQVKSWAGSRTVDGESSPVVFRQGKSTDLPDNALRFRLAAPPTPEQEAEAAEKRAKEKARREAKAAEKAKAGAGK